MLSKMEVKEKFVTFSNASNMQRFVVVNTSAISSIMQESEGVVRITLKEIKDGNSVSFTGNYDLKTILSMLS